MSGTTVSNTNPYDDFTKRLQLLCAKNPQLIETTLSNVFTMRLLGNKTHGDLAEIAISEFINQFMYDFQSRHVGKDLYRSKDNEEDISVISEISGLEIPISLKAYGDGPLQLSTDKSSLMYPFLKSIGHRIEGSDLSAIWSLPEFAAFGGINILPLIYRERSKECNILVFDSDRARNAVSYIALEKAGGRRKHPVYKFFDNQDQYICEVRYGGRTANALQRGLWTHTRHAYSYFDSLTGGWKSYSHNLTLVELFSHALVSTSVGHENALVSVKDDIIEMKEARRR